jgi:L-iditol 2-dehydrogenase
LSHAREEEEEEKCDKACMGARVKAALLSEAYRIDIVGTDRPKTRDAEVLIRVKSNGICGSDVHAYRGHHAFRKPPVILGHEVSGIVEEVGRAVVGVEAGDRVAVEPQEGCGRCPQCLAGKENICVSRAAPGIGDWKGSFAQYFAAPAGKVYRLPQGMSYDTGALMEPLAVGVHAARRAGVGLGDSVAVLGVGTIGLMSLVAARKAGASRLYASDLLDFNLGKARELGGDVLINPGREDLLGIMGEREPYGVDKVIVTAAFPPVWEQAVGICRSGGTVCVVGMFGEPVSVDLLGLLLREKSIHLSWLYGRRDFLAAIDIAGAVDLEPMITHRLPLEEAAKGLKMMDERKEDIVKILLNS